jgi:hypothetical protein
MDSQHKPAIRPAWKVSTIPQNASNATDPTVASSQELEAVIANPGALQTPNPVEVGEGLDPAPRYNANVPYTPEPIIYNAQDEELMKRIRVAIQNGWKEYHRFANDSVTIGMEAEAVIQGMKKQHMQVQQLLLDEEFGKYAWK